MSKVISFKVSNDVYDNLKSLNLSFKELFEPFAIKLSKKQLNKGYTGRIPINYYNDECDDIDILVDQVLSRYKWIIKDSNNEE